MPGWLRRGCCSVVWVLSALGCADAANDLPQLTHVADAGGQPQSDAGGGGTQDGGFALVDSGRDDASAGRDSSIDSGGVVAEGGGPAKDGGGLGSFHVQGGKILDPRGNIWRGYGVAVYDQQVLGTNGYTGGAALAAQMLQLMPKINLIRVACYSMSTPASYAEFANYMTQRGIVVVFEDHNNQHTVLTGTALQNESNWYISMAKYYLGNKFVMFQTMNEPNVGDAYQEQATYNAIRSTGNDAIIFMEAGDWAGGGDIGDTSVFTAMHDVAWDMHGYGGDVHFASTLTDILKYQDQTITYLHGIPSADGVMPVIILEGGNSNNGTTIDPGAIPQVEANFTNPNLVGFAAWIWNNWKASDIVDNLTNADGTSLNSYGQQVAGYIANGQGPVM